MPAHYISAEPTVSSNNVQDDLWVLTGQRGAVGTLTWPKRRCGHSPGQRGSVGTHLAKGWDLKQQVVAQRLVGTSQELRI